MHIFFSGIGGTGIGPLAIVAQQAGHHVSGSDKQDSQYIAYLHEHGITDIHIGQTKAAIAAVHAKQPIDWIVYSSAVEKEQAQSAELEFASQHGIKATKRDPFINQILKDSGQQMIAIAGTHGKTTTTAMTVWLMLQLKQPVSYILPAKTSFADMGHFDISAKYFVYEADEYDRNFLAYQPTMSIITGIDWDHPDIYPTREDYYSAFRQFIDQSQQVIMWKDDAQRLKIDKPPAHIKVIEESNYRGFEQIGQVNRDNAAEAAEAIASVLGGNDFTNLIKLMNKFPGVSRRFETIVDNVYSDYAHTPEKIRGALQAAHEVVDGTERKLLVVYEGLHNTRQHFIKDQLADLFKGVDQLLVVPSYRAREDESLEDLTPQKLIDLMGSPDNAQPAELNAELKSSIETAAAAGDLVLCLSAGGGGSLDEWLRQEFK